MGVLDDQGVSIKVCCAAGVTQLAQAEEVVGKAGDDVSEACLGVWDRGQGEAGRGSRFVCFTCGRTDSRGWCCVVTVGYRGGRHEIVLASSCVSYCRGMGEGWAMGIS